MNNEILAALEEARRAIGDHYAPNDCYATGPMTGDAVRDLVQCPACSAIAMYDDLKAKLAVTQPAQSSGQSLEAALEKVVAESVVGIGSYGPNYDSAKLVKGFRALAASQPLAPQATAPITPKHIEEIKDILPWPVTEDDARAARDMLQSLHFDLSMAQDAAPQASQGAGLPVESVLATGQILAAERRSTMLDDEALRFGRSIESAVLRALAATMPSHPTVPEGYVLMPIEPDHAVIRAMSASQARDDEGEFTTLGDLIDFSGDNKTHTCLRAAYAAAIDAAPSPLLGDQNGK